jgi:hypothetical protein
MDDPEKEPLLFANRAIQHYAKAFLDDVELTPRDCTKIRVMFRSLGGSWFEIAQGDSAMVGKLSQVVKSWGQAAKAKKSRDP